MRAFELSYHGAPMAGTNELMHACCGGKRLGIVTSYLGGRVIPAGQSVKFLSLARTPETEEAWLQLERARNDIEVRACYCSALGDCWALDMRSVEPAPVPSCADAARRQQYVP